MFAVSIETIRNIKRQALIPKQKKYYSIPRVSKKKAAQIKQQKENGSDQSVDTWFDYHIQHSKMVCENCGEDLSHYSYEDWRHSQHHIIEKSKINGCPSVAAEIMNHGVLCKWKCHPQWHTNWANAVKMPFFTIAKHRFELFRYKIHPEEIRKIPECFLT